jgi:hypothetical protein
MGPSRSRLISTFDLVNVAYGSMLSKKGLSARPNVFPAEHSSAGGVGDDGAAGLRAAAAVYEFNLDDMIPADHLLRRLNVLVAAALAICMVACGRSTATLIAHPSIQS